MRFAWQLKDSKIFEPVEQSNTNRIIYVAYNVIWWVPVVLPFTKIIDYCTGFVAFFVLTLVRAIVNLYRNNVLTSEQAVRFPLRAP